MSELCRRFQESWDDTERPKEMVEHLNHCEFCRSFARNQAQLRQALSAWTVPEFSPDFDLTVMSRLTEEVAKQPRHAINLRELFTIQLPVPLPIGAMAVLALVVSLILNVYLWNTQSGNSNSDTNQIPVIQIDTTPNNVPKRAPGVPIEWLGSGSFLVIPIPPQDPFYVAEPESVPANGTHNNTL